MTEEVTLENLPIHVLRKEAKKKEIKFTTSDKKKDLIKMLIKGETNHKPREIKRAPQLEDTKAAKSLPIIPTEIMPELEQMKARGLTWEIDEESGCISFKRDIMTCANLDQPSKNILMTARQAFAGSRPVEVGRGYVHPFMG